MSINAKHLATFILGAAAGVAAHKYLQSEEGEKLLEDLKTKANDLKAEAEGAIDKAPEYFEELKAKGSDGLKSFTVQNVLIFLLRSMVSVFALDIKSVYLFILLL